MKYHHPTSQYYISPPIKPPIIQRSKTGSATVPPAHDVNYNEPSPVDATYDTDENEPHPETSTSDTTTTTKEPPHFDATPKPNQRQRKQSKPLKNFAVGDPKLLIPLTHDTSTEQDNDTTQQSTGISMSTGSEYTPSENEARHAYDTDADDSHGDQTVLPDIAWAIFCVLCTGCDFTTCAFHVGSVSLIHLPIYRLKG